MQRRDFIKAATLAAPFLADRLSCQQVHAGPLPGSDTDSWELWGIAELRCWFNMFNKVPQNPQGPYAEESVDAHLEAGIHHVVWELGRSVLAYHSRLTGATCWGLHDRLGKLGEKIEFERMFQARCQLRAGLEHARKKGIVLYGRLCMNRNYSPGFKRSRIHNDHPEWRELQKDGKPDPSRLCYALPEYRRERRNILVEAAEIGCHGLCLDFCRQPPMVRYHPALVDAYRKHHGADPRDLSRVDKEAFLDWCRFRAAFITTFLHELKESLAASHKRGGRKVPIHARIPNDGLEANLICGLDVKRWCEEGLVDELAPSHMNWLAEYQRFDDLPYIELGRQHALPVYCSVSFNWPPSCSGPNPLVLARRVRQLFRSGLAGVVFFQSDRGVQLPGFRELLPRFSSRAGLDEMLVDRELKEKWPIKDNQDVYGIDHHSFFGRLRDNAGREDANGA